MVQVETQEQNFSRGCISLLTFFVQAKKVSRPLCKRGRNPLAKSKNGEIKVKKQSQNPPHLTIKSVKKA
ncbi:hypothetical protein A6A20_01065 [Volucribacter amazonae]|uniref:Uncharacterized protein n=1 Tax=Volucribacter amazonae TaxID=256731 RepID=A0A9X4SKQ1_9PAST|nr:hypothetical protein [Volucribacter amazonae]